MEEIISWILIGIFLTLAVGGYIVGLVFLSVQGIIISTIFLLIFIVGIALELERAKKNK